MKLLAYLSGALLLATSLCLFLVNLTSAVVLVWPHEPIFGLSAPWLFWIVGGIAFLIAAFCLFNNHSEWQPFLVAWYASVFVSYLVGLYWEGCRGLTGYLGGFSHTFGISAKTANASAVAITGCLFVTGYGQLLWLWRNRRFEAALVKMPCPACGGHIKFAIARLGENMPCPHCQAAVVLRKPENLKISCYFCKEHIEFPAHALGTKISCPHCKRGITLQLSVPEFKPAT